MRSLIVLLALCTLASCNRNSHQEMSRFHEDGRLKPSVSIASLLDTSSFDASWNLSEEMTQGVMKQIAAQGTIYVRSEQESPFTENPFSTDLSWMKREFHSEEFVAFMELVEHEFTPVKTKSGSTEETSSNLNMAVRIRVVDLRSQTPKIVLQETIRDSYFIPKTLIPCDYSVHAWGTEAYRKTPMGVAHAQLIHEVASRISDYILLAKSQ